MGELPIDHQFKIRGHRVEAAEVEAAVREITGAAVAVALPWPPGNAAPQALLVAVEGLDSAKDPAQERALLTNLRSRLPEAMLPSRLVALPRLETQVSGKVDRAAVAKQVEAMLARPITVADAYADTDLGMILEALRTVAPHLLPDPALSLLASGLDSLSLVALSALLEQHFGAVLDADSVARLAELPLVEVPKLLRGGSHIAAANAGLTAGSPRANRVFQFIRRFPEVVSKTDQPMLLAVGSSGLFRAFDPAVAERVAAAHGHGLRALNVGLPAIDVASLTLICRFIRETCQRHGLRLPIVVYEFDPMMLSVLMPATDLRLTHEHFRRSPVCLDVDDDLQWVAERGGAPRSMTVERCGIKPAPSSSHRPVWRDRREREVAEVYAGSVPFSPEPQRDWLNGLYQLADIADRLVVFTHPLDAHTLADMTPVPAGTHLDELMSTLRGEWPSLPITQLDWHSFAPGYSDFMDFNHASPGVGSTRITEQLMENGLSETGPDSASAPYPPA